MTSFVTIRSGNGQCDLTAPAVKLLLRLKAKEQCYQVDKDEQFFLANLNAEGTGSHLHTGISFRPSVRQRRGLIALSAICTRESERALSTVLQSTAPMGKYQPLHPIKGGGIDA
jgi:hypothetical protein